MAKAKTLGEGLEFDICSPEGQAMRAMAIELMQSTLSARKNRVTDYRTMDQVRVELLPVRDFYFQYFLGSYGIPKRSLLEIIGGKGLGKTTLALWIAGEIIDKVGAPTLFLEGEGKPIDANRSIRTMSTDPVRAKRLLNSITFKSVKQLAEMHEELMLFCKTWRGENVRGKQGVAIPRSIPLIVIVDPFSKLLNQAEANGFYDYNKNMDEANKKKAKDIGEGSNLGHSNWAAGWGRRLGHIMEFYNVLLIVTHHQNCKIDMSAGGGGGISLPENTAALYNTVKIGGKATEQNAATMIILAQGGQVKDSDGSVRGKYINARVEKNSYGPGNRKISWELREVCDPFDIEGKYLDGALHFEDEMGKWMATEKLCGVTVDRKRYSSKELNLNGATGLELSQAFHADKDLMNKLGKDLRMVGYDDLVDRIEEEHRNEASEEKPTAKKKSKKDESAE